MSSRLFALPQMLSSSSTAIILSSAASRNYRPQSADDARIDQYLHAIDRVLAEDANVKWITISLRRASAKRGHSRAAVGARNKPIEGGRERRSVLRAVDAQVSRFLINFVLHQVKWC